MLCPNCKTELIEVNGRYICSDCGKEVPEEEVMTSNWGNSAPAADGIYGAVAPADAPEAGSMPVATFSDSADEPEGIPPAEAAESVLQEQADEAVFQAPVVEKSQDTQAVESVEAVLQDQADAGFYAAPASQSESMVPIPDIPAEAPAPATPMPVEAIPATLDILGLSEDLPPEVTEESAQQDLGGIVDDPTATAPAPVEPKLLVTPVTLPTPEELAPIPEPVEAVPEETEVVKDMFESVSAAPIEDPGLYASPDSTPVEESNTTLPVANTRPQLSNEKRVNLLILAIGVFLALVLIGGGTWAFIALSSKTKVDPQPVVVEDNVTWQELQVVGASFKISFPGQPEKSEAVQLINDLDTTVFSQVYTSGDVSYTAAYAAIPTGADSLTKLVDDLATAQGLDKLTEKIGKYYDADAIDFTLGADGTQRYQGKIMLKDNNYILIEAGSLTSKSVDYDKFIKSFAFLTAGTAGTIK